ncbi:MAG TPA: hypothetical protein PLD95_04055 [bacterium]|jgi:hypothetical protein|nr:hypothetical protein [bacterium]
MPNWCENVLTISGLKNVLDEFIVVARLNKPKPCNLNNLDVCEEDEVLNFNSLYPIPSNISNATDTYDWEVKNWGCKWGASSSRLFKISNTVIGYDFLTPWSPPIKFLLKVSKDFPELKFYLKYKDEGNEYKGSITIKKGLVIKQK